MRATVEFITPLIASTMLKDNGHNRKLSDVARDKYAEAMTRGAWIQNGAPIILSGDTLLDGQHRLSAVQKTGIGREFVVVRDLHSSAFTSIDTGRRRNLRDILTIEKKAHPKVLALAITHHATFTATGNFQKSRVQKNMTYAEHLAYEGLHPQIAKSVEFVCSFVTRKALMDPGPTSCLHALFCDRDPLLAETFIRKFMTGENISEHDPVRLLRDKLIEAKMSMYQRMAPDEKSVSMILAWNATRAGVPVSRFVTKARNKKGTRKVSIK